MLIVNQIVCPILVGEKDPAGRVTVNGNVLGTGFSIGGSHLMTAGHVVRELQAAAGRLGLVATPGGEAWTGAAITASEVLDADIGIVRCSFVDGTVPTLGWNLDNLNVLAPVKTFGYAYGLHIIDDERMIVARAFRGEVVCTLPRYRPLGFDGPLFSVHELSFQTPRGLSGAPLVTDEDQVKGVIIGNSQTEMLVSSETDTDADGSLVRSVERVERLTLGIAVRAIDIASLRSDLLSGTVADHLRDHALLPQESGVQGGES